MKFERAHLWNRDSGVEASATVHVEGLGMVEFKHALSSELCDRVRMEIETALRLRLGQKLPLESTAP